MKHKVFAVYDISSSSVAGAHVLQDENKKVFLASARSDAPLQEDMDIKRFVDDTVKHLDQIITKIRKADHHQPDYIQVILASPWYSSQTRTIIFNKDTAFLCTQKMVDDLIEKEIKHILKNEKGSFGEYGKDSFIVEKQISQIRLNGYDTSAPYGKKAKSLELFLTITIAPKPILDRFKEVISRGYGDRKIGFTTSPFATYVALRDTMIIEKECVVIDVGEEVTDVAFIKGDIMLYQHSFPVGTYALYRTLSKNGSHTYNEAAAMLESFRHKKLSTQSSKSVNDAIAAYTKEWQMAFRQVLDEGQYGFCLPANCLITADPRFEDILVTVIKTDPFIQHSCSQGVINATFTDKSLFKNISSVDTSEIDIPLATAAVYTEHII